jgi:predicted GIY-YIG superfamily endonuclease
MAKNYSKACGCLCEEGIERPWYACVTHALVPDAPQPQPTTTSSSRPFWLYVLQLQDGKYYVGMTNRKSPNDRIKQHGGARGARWTHKHKPLGVLEVRSLGDVTKQQAEYAEHQLTLELINTYGHHSVRGGALTYSGDYTKFLNHYFRDYEWGNLFGAILTICALLLAVLFFALH